MKKYLLFILLIISKLNFSQVTSDTSKFLFMPSRFNYLTSDMNKQYNTYNLHSSFQLTHITDLISLSINEKYHSTLIDQSEKSIRDENSFFIIGGVKVNKFSEFGARIENAILSDNRKIEINKSSISSGYIYSKILLEENISFTPFIGYENNKQIGEEDNGLLYGGEGLISNYMLGEIFINADFKIRNAEISPRKGINQILNLSILNYFENNVKNIFQIKYFFNKKDFYFEADSVLKNTYNINKNIQGRGEYYYSAQNILTIYNFLDYFTLETLGRISFRDINRNTAYKNKSNLNQFNFDNKINEFKFDVEANLNYLSSNFQVNLKMFYNERDEQHTAIQELGIDVFLFEENKFEQAKKNNSSNRASLALSGIYKFDKTDIISFSLYQNKLVYNTPAKENYDDRDEVLSIAKIQYNKMLNPFFDAFISVEGTLNHIVYLYSAKSSNNYYNRILKLSTGGEYIGKRLKSFNSFDVNANYTTYDFEDLNPTNRSISFRQFTALDSSRFEISKNYEVLFNGYYKLSEQGNLKWKSFKTTPFRYLEELFFEPKLGYHKGAISLSAGMRYFQLNTFKYLDSKTKSRLSSYISRGPIITIGFDYSLALHINSYLWYEIISSEGSKKMNQINFLLNINWLI